MTLDALIGNERLLAPPAWLRALTGRGRGGMPMPLGAAIFGLALLVAACGGSAGDGPISTGPTGVGRTPVAADITLLFMGNSHSESNDLPGMVVAMVRAGRPGKTVEAALAPGYLFLDDRLKDGPSIELLRSQNWSFVILQAQKYSTSGQFTYSTAEAAELVRMSRGQNAVPIMFPEWPRAGIPETQRIYDLHISIAQREPACVAPIGQAWDLSLTSAPKLTLHAGDGNHSNPAGAFLTALVLYATITGASPLDLPPLTQFPVDAGTQTFLRDIADQTVRLLPPRLWCPADPFT